MKWNTFKKRSNILIFIVLLSFILSLGYSFFYRIRPVVDAQAYDNIALNLRDGFGFLEDRTKSYEFDTAILRAGPGYEFFLAGIYAVFGHKYEAVWILQALLHAASALLLFFISRRLFTERGEIIGLIAAAMFGLHPDLIEISAMLMTETLYLFLIVLTLYLFVRVYHEQQRLYFSVLLGLVLGASILTRPPTLLFAPVILFAYYQLKNYRAALLFCVGLVLLIFPWAIRNYLIYHQFILTTLIGSYNLWGGNTLFANGGQISGGFNPVTAYTDAYGFFGLKAKASAEFWAFVFGHPLVFLKLSVIRFIRYFSLIRPMGFWFYQTGWHQVPIVITSGISIAVLFWSGFSGMIYALKEKRPILYYLISFAVLAPLALIPTVVQSRYRFQIYPFLTLFGGYVIAIAVNKHVKIKKYFIYVLVGLLVISLIDVVLAWQIVATHIRFLIF